MAEKKQFYWLKLKRDFFKRHDIRIIEAMPNGKDYVLFYLKLLCESVDHEGNLRFSDQIPYSADMLATITNTNVDVVKAAVKVFTELGMMEILDDGTVYMSEVQKMLGYETNWASQKREQRERLRTQENAPGLLDGGQCPPNVHQVSSAVHQEKEIEKELDKEKEKKSRFAPPSADEVREYCIQRKNNIDAEAFIDFYTSKGWKVGNQPMKDWKAAVRTWEKRHQNDSKPKGKFYGFEEHHHTEESDKALEKALLDAQKRRNEKWKAEESS